MSVELAFGVAESPEMQYRAIVLRNVLVSCSKLCADMLEDVGLEEQSIMLPIPFISNSKIARLVVEFLLGNPLSLESQPSKVVFEIMMAANGMYIQPLLDQTIDEIARRWKGLPTKEIRTQWGFANNLSADLQAQIVNENHVLFSFEAEEEEEKEKVEEEKQDKWGWPIELLTLVLEKRSTREMARVRAVCFEFFHCIHFCVKSRGDFFVCVSNDLQAATLGFAERHGVMNIRNSNDVDLVLALNDSSKDGLQRVRILSSVKLDNDQTLSLKQLKNLHHLEWKECNNLGEKGAQAIATLSNLQHLRIGHKNYIGPEGAKALASMTSLRRLEIGGWNAIGAEGAKFLAQLSKLEYLTIGYLNGIGEVGAKWLQELSNLTHLTIGSENKIGAEGVKYLTSLSRLEYLFIGSENHIGVEGAKALASLANLKTLFIQEENDIGAEGARFLKNLSKLQVLNIGSWNNIGAEGVTSLKELSNLRDLRIWRENGIGTEGAKALACLVNLERLIIGAENYVGVEGAKALASIASLQDLQIYSMNEIGMEGVRALVLLPNLKCLEIQEFGNGLDLNELEALRCVHPNIRITVF